MSTNAIFSDLKGKKVIVTGGSAFSENSTSIGSRYPQGFVFHSNPTAALFEIRGTWLTCKLAACRDPRNLVDLQARCLSRSEEPG